MGDGRRDASQWEDRDGPLVARGGTSMRSMSQAYPVPICGEDGQR